MFYFNESLHSRNSKKIQHSPVRCFGYRNTSSQREQALFLPQSKEGRGRSHQENGIKPSPKLFPSHLSPPEKKLIKREEKRRRILTGNKSLWWRGGISICGERTDRRAAAAAAAVFTLAFGRGGGWPWRRPIPARRVNEVVRFPE